MLRVWLMYRGDYDCNILVFPLYVSCPHNSTTTSTLSSNIRSEWSIVIEF